MIHKNCSSDGQSYLWRPVIDNVTKPVLGLLVARLLGVKKAGTQGTAMLEQFCSASGG